jgi:hypothetical protein
LGDKVYRKPTNTNLYLNSNSQHHPSNKQAVLSTLVHRARSLCDQESLHGELEFLRTTFRKNDYSDRQIRRPLNPPARVASTPEKPESVAFLPYVGTTFNRISRLLSRHIKSVGLPPNIPSFLRPVKDDLGLKDSWCVQHALRVWSSLHRGDRPFHRDQGQGAPAPRPSAACRQVHVAEHIIHLDHRIKFQDTTILSTQSRCMDRLIREATEIELHPNNKNREGGLRLSRSRKPLIHTIEGRRKHPIQHCQSRPGH